VSEDGRPALAEDAPGTGRRPAGALESEVLSILRRSDVPLSPGEVRQLLGAAGHGDGPRGELSYSTVVTIVSRLHAKGLLTRNRAGRGFTYFAVDEAGLAASRMNRALGSGTDRTAVLSRFVSGLSERDARMLRDLLASDPGPPGDGLGPLADGLGPAAGRE
jgi:predicted transcriptional regulator